MRRNPNIVIKFVMNEDDLFIPEKICKRLHIITPSENYLCNYAVVAEFICNETDPYLNRKIAMEYLKELLTSIVISPGWYTLIPEIYQMFHGAIQLIERYDHSRIDRDMTRKLYHAELDGNHSETTLNVIIGDLSIAKNHIDLLEGITSNDPFVKIKDFEDISDKRLST